VWLSSMGEDLRLERVGCPRVGPSLTVSSSAKTEMRRVRRGTASGSPEPLRLQVLEPERQEAVDRLLVAHVDAPRVGIHRVEDGRDRRWLTDTVFALTYEEKPSQA